MEPLEMKYRAVSRSPACTSVSPGGACVVLNFMARARRQPLVAPRNGLQCCSSERFRCRQMSACRHSGKPFSTCGRVGQLRTPSPECCLHPGTAHTSISGKPPPLSPEAWGFPECLERHLVPNPAALPLAGHPWSLDLHVLRESAGPIHPSGVGRFNSIPYMKGLVQCLP